MIESSPSERAIDGAQVDAYEYGTKAEIDELAGERGGVALPDRIEAAHAETAEARLAIAADVLEKEITEADRPDPLRALLLEHAPHARLGDPRRGQGWVADLPLRPADHLG